jgi:glycosyltransferase involved in cell wall biosynthesis
LPGENSLYHRWLWFRRSAAPDGKSGFRQEFEQAGIIVHAFQRTGKGFSTGVLKALWRLKRQGRYDMALSFLDSPNIYNILSRWFSGQSRLVVSERNSYLRGESYWPRLALFSMAHAVVANSLAQSDWLRERVPWLKHSACCIYNGLDPSRFAPRPGLLEPAERPAQGEAQRYDRLLVIGRVSRQKNGDALVASLQLFHDQHGFCPKLTWVGRTDEPEARARIEARLEACPAVKANWQWLGERNDIPALLASHDALILPSLFEGLPNVVCESLAVGVPVVASHVCDHPLLVPSGERGFLMDPADPRDMARAIGQLVFLSPEKYWQMARACHDYAMENLTIASMARRYDELFRRLAPAASGKPSSPGGSP